MRKENKDLIMLLQIMNIPDLGGYQTWRLCIVFASRKNKEVVQLCPQSGVGIKSLEATYTSERFLKFQNLSQKLVGTPNKWYLSSFSHNCHTSIVQPVFYIQFKWEIFQCFTSVRRLKSAGEVWEVKIS